MVLVTNSIIIAHYGKSDYLAGCLESIKLNTHIQHEVITVDTKDPRISVACAWNRGIDRSNGEIITILNDDTLVSEFWLTRLYWALLGIEDVCVVTPSTSYCASTVYTSLFNQIKPEINTVEDVNSFNREISRYYGVSYEMLESHVVGGFCAMFRKSDWESVRGFHEGFKYAFGEENDFFDKLDIEHGKKFALVRGIYVHHFKGKTVKRVSDFNIGDCKVLYDRRRHERRRKRKTA